MELSHQPHDGICNRGVSDGRPVCKKETHLTAGLLYQANRRRLLGAGRGMVLGVVLVIVALVGVVDVLQP